MSLTTTVKTTINIDEEVWEEFKRTVDRNYGGSRNLSKVVEEAIRNYNTLELLREAAKALNIEPGAYPSSTEVETNRPSAEGTSRLVREMRDDREARLHGH
ncbi:MAG TPA: hypothetical protein VGB32_13440 [Candidatus Bathyarchaeia archaeon]